MKTQSCNWSEIRKEWKKSKKREWKLRKVSYKRAFWVNDNCFVLLHDDEKENGCGIKA